MKNHNKTGSKVPGLILFEKHAVDNAGNRVKETVKKRAAMKKESPEVFVNGENAVSVGNMDQFKSHRDYRRQGRNGCGSGKERI